MRQSASINSSDRFFFPAEIVTKTCEEGFLIVAVTTANWLVLRSELQKNMLQLLIEGNTVGDVYTSLTPPDEQRQFSQLLAAITARDFARTDHVPTPQYLEGYRMLNIYLTNACNLRCEHCFMRSGTPFKNELPATEWCRILSEFKTYGGQSVTFSGGEPLMNRDFDDILIHASSQQLETTVLSNGILWTQERIAKLAPHISQIQISIDGFDEPSNAKIRGTGHFDRIVHNVITFANCGVRTSVATTFTFQNLQNDAAARYADFVSCVKSQCQHPVFFKLSKKVLQGRNTHYSEEQNREFFRRIMEIEQAIDPNARFNNFMEGHTPNLVERNCGFGGISIGADGEVYFCNRISEVESYGNIRGHSLKPFMEQGHKLHLQTSADHLSPCATCHLRYICCGGCRIDDSNFQGKLKNHVGPLRQVKCNDESIAALEQKMIDGFMFYYKF